MDHLQNPNSNSLQNPNSNRIILLDVFRGFAIFGIFVVNIEIMNCIFINQGAFHGQFTSLLDQVSFKVMNLFFYTKFFPLFSLLFGIGIGMQSHKREGGKMAIGFLSRRMGVLLFFGILHILLFWPGDVLHIYALLGLFMLPFLSLSRNIILGFAFLALLFPFYGEVVGSFFNWIVWEPRQYLERYSSEELVGIIRHGTYLEGMSLRIKDFLFNLPMTMEFFAPVAFSMFLFGVYLVKRGVVFSLLHWVDKAKWSIIAVAVILNIYRLIFLFYLIQTDVYRTYRTFFIQGMIVSDIAMGIFYLWVIAWLWENGKGRVFLESFQWVGRMALTNYILQSAIGLFLFSSLGLSLYEMLGPSQTIVIAIGVFAFQVVLSRYWLTYYRYGPLEWFWRVLSYGEGIPFKKQVVVGKVRLK